MTSQQFWTGFAVVVPVVGAFILAAYRTRSTNNAEGRSASAAEVTALGERLDAQAIEIRTLQRQQRAFYNYIANDHAEHRKNGWPIIALPEEIA